ncbi:protein containing DUF1566, partial [Candidatus Magnetobacterium bavaricum]
MKIASGLTTQFTVTPETGYTASVTGTCGGKLVDTTYTTEPIKADCTVEATFTQTFYTVTPSAGTGGTIDPSTPVKVGSGLTTKFTVTPNKGYTASADGCGGKLAGTTYTTGAITGDCKVTATFTPSTVSLPQTGQTKCYDEGGKEISCIATGQDGDLKKGVAWPDPRFKDNGDKTVTDNLTGLVWTKDAGTPTVDSCAGGKMNWQAAIGYVACLNKAKHLGYTDWRL